MAPTFQQSVRVGQARRLPCEERLSPCICSRSRHLCASTFGAVSALAPTGPLSPGSLKEIRSHPHPLLKTFLCGRHHTRANPGVGWGACAVAPSTSGTRPPDPASQGALLAGRKDECLHAHRDGTAAASGCLCSLAAGQAPACLPPGPPEPGHSGLPDTVGEAMARCLRAGAWAPGGPCSAPTLIFEIRTPRSCPRTLWATPTRPSSTLTPASRSTTAS